MFLRYLLFTTTLFYLSCQSESPKKEPLSQIERNASRIISETDLLIKQYQDLDIFSGVVLIAEKGHPFYLKAFGLSNRETGKANTVRTRFNIGSMNKTFTKLLIYKLLEEGILRREDNLGKFLAGFPDEAASKITIDYLLSHRSGYGDYFTPDFFQSEQKTRNIAGIVERARKLPLLFQPGTEQEYSNTGYVLLGAIIEKVSGKSYYENIKEHITIPLKLNETFVENTHAVKNRAVGYFKTIKGELEDNLEFQEQAKPDGGFYSTAADILKFYQVFYYSDSLLSTPIREADPFIRRAIELYAEGGDKAFGSAGGFNGTNTVIYEMPGIQTSVLVFANMDEPVAEQLGQGILAIIRGKTPQKPHLPAGQNVYKAFKSQGIKFVKTNFDSLTINFHPDDPRDLILNNIGYELMWDKEIDDAIAMFTLNTELFPDAANCYDSLGEAWLQKGDRKKALVNYKRALELDPQMPSAQRAVAQLQ
ncbi:MAG: serine hydrolase [Calditrichia bacterium]